MWFVLVMTGFAVAAAAIWWFIVPHNAEKELPPQQVAQTEPNKEKDKKKQPKPDITAKAATAKAAGKARKDSAVADSNIVNNIRGHADDVTDISLSKCGRLLASVSKDRTVRVFTSADDTPFPAGCKTNYARINLNGVHGTACVFSDDSKYLAVALAPSQAVDFYGIKIADHKVVATLLHSFPTGHTETITNIHLGVNSSCVITMCRGLKTEVKVWEPKGTLIQEVDTKQMVNNKSSLSADGKLLCVATKMTDSKVWAVKEQKFGGKVSGGSKVTGLEAVMVLKNHKRSVSCVSFSECAEFKGPMGIATGSIDGSWRYFDLSVDYTRGADPKLLHTGESGFDTVECIAVAPRRDGLIAVTCGSALHFYKRTGEEAYKVDDAHKGNVFGLEWSADGSYLATFGDDKTVRMWKSPC